MRQIPIFEITPNPSTANEPQSFTVSGDVRDIFHGSYWTNGASIVPFYSYNAQSNPAPYGTYVVPATTFFVAENSDFGGAYTVYTKQNASDAYDSCVYNASTNKSKIYVSTIMPQGTKLNVGVITQISTYKFSIGNSYIVVNEREENNTLPISLVGRFTPVWGEIIQQNLLRLAQNFASTTTPSNPPTGMSWFDKNTGQLKIWNGTVWVPVTNSVSEFKYRQTTAASSWTITHNLNLAAPYIADVTMFVDTANGVKMIAPQDITFSSANALTVSFTSNYTGYAIIKK